MRLQFSLFYLWLVAAVFPPKLTGIEEACSHPASFQGRCGRPFSGGVATGVNRRKYRNKVGMIT